MKKNRFVTLVIFFSISFSILHDFTLDIFNKSQDSVSHYVDETQYKSKLMSNGDVGEIHYLFHSPMLAMFNTYFPLPISLSSKIQINQKFYLYNYANTFLKPPISLNFNV